MGAGPGRGLGSAGRFRCRDVDPVRAAGPRDAVTCGPAGPADRLDLLIGWERTRAWVDAQQQSLLAALAEDPDFAPTADPSARHGVREEVACALRLSPQTAAARLADAADLTSRLPATLAAVQSGQITLPHARALLDAVRTLPDRADPAGAGDGAGDRTWRAPGP